MKINQCNYLYSNASTKNYDVQMYRRTDVQKSGGAFFLLLALRCH